MTITAFAFLIALFVYLMGLYLMAITMSFTPKRQMLTAVTALFLWPVIVCLLLLWNVTERWRGGRG